MNNKRLELLIKVYLSVKCKNDINYAITLNDYYKNKFDYQVLEEQGFIELFKKNGINYALITLKGIECAEEIVQPVMEAINNVYDYVTDRLKVIFDYFEELGIDKELLFK